VAGKVIDAVDGAIRSKAGGIGHKTITGVRTGTGATLIRPPTLFKPHRDEMVQAIQSVLTAT
jgi:hypothetical protein